MKNILLCLLFGCVAIAFAQNVYPVHFLETSVKSYIFEPAHANKKLVHTSECGKTVEDSYGVLEKTYKQGSAKNGDKCTWKLHAPANHIIHIISIGFDLEDPVNSVTRDEVNTSKITIYDSAEVGISRLARIDVSFQERHAAFVQSVSSGQDVVVEVEYHDNKMFGTQKMSITYEFLGREEMKELLRTRS